ncbi:MAG TPA: hypothetical protein VGJ79_03555 [Candidatus Dormibacteraeota bacterium]|jgi:hypothetical protein
MPKNPKGKAEAQFLQNRKVVGPVVALPKMGKQATSPLTPASQAHAAKVRAQMRALLPGLWNS